MAIRWRYSPQQEGFSSNEDESSDDEEELESWRRKDNIIIYVKKEFNKKFWTKLAQESLENEIFFL